MKDISGRVRNRIGEKYGRLIVKEFKGTDKNNHAIWSCECDCGTKEKIVKGMLLQNGKTKSCGCLKKESLEKSKYKHGGAKKGKHDNLYGRWSAMKSRCYRESHQSYKNYGARGITVCDEWHEYKNFKRWAELSGFKEEMQLDRIDNNKGYGPDNCKWSTISQNQSNKRSNNFVEINGVRKTLTQWSEETGISFFTLKSRQTRGWEAEEFLLPVGSKRTL